MAWKRRRDAGRKLPKPGSRRLNTEMARGPYSRVPGTPPGAEVSISASGRVTLGKPWYRSRWILFLPAGVLACYLFFPFLFHGGVFFLLPLVLGWLIYRTWRP